MVCKDTLKIKNLPKELSDAQKEDFARHFGATKVKVITSRVKEKTVVYAKFDTDELAKNVLFRLHQTTVLNSVLCVEYAENDLLQGKPNFRKVEEINASRTKFLKNFITKLSAFNESVGFNQPPPPHLKYLYPKANRATINNIAHALATIPRFYVQVLHLMNRMNLPPPFAVEQPPAARTAAPQIATQKPPEKAPVPVPPPPPSLQPESHSKPEMKPQESSSESELESDEEDYFRNREFVPVKRRISQNKVIKRPKFVKIPVAHNQNVATKVMEKAEDVFEKTEVQVPKKIELKVPLDALERSRTQLQPENVGTIDVSQEPQEKETKTPEEVTAETDEEIKPEVVERPAITSEELAANQIPYKDLGILPVFKNYHPGVPTTRLYIKNCAKTVTNEDLEYIYNRYKLPEEKTPSQFDIRLMKEGRMKGQAFVTLDSIELAQKAIKETNGYILKDKPLVVVFARSAVQKI